MSNKLSLKKNIEYKTAELAQFFSNNRLSFDQFYKSEKVMLETIDWFKDISVLDVGCGCGGLGKALNDKFDVHNYVGIDINQQSIDQAFVLNNNLPFSFIKTDILEFKSSNLFDVVVSFSCIDWNTETFPMIKKCWSLTKPGGIFLATVRLAEKSKNILDNSYQYINFSGEKNGEVAPYVIFSYSDIFKIGHELGCEDISLNGYFNAPSKSAVTDYKELFFCCVSFKKPINLS